MGQITYQTPECPECGKDACAEIDWIPGDVQLIRDEDGTFDYEGTTKVNWDGQVNDCNQRPWWWMESEGTDKPPAKGNRYVCCEDGHTWTTQAKGGNE